MDKIMTYETLRRFTYSNDKICKKPIKGIAISFFGLNGLNMFHEDPEDAIMYAENGIIYLIPYNNPWAWMNPQAIQYTDEILDVLFEEYNLPADIPIVSTGGSMGGLSAFTYCVYAKRTPTACVVNCPVCDLPYHYTERNDVPRTLYSAFYNEQGPVEKVLEKFSPVHLIDQLPDIPYYIFHCDKDFAVNIDKHTNTFVKKVGDKLNITYHVVPDRNHCDIGEEMKALYQKYIVDSVIG